MEVKAAPRGFLSGNALKLIAAAAMLTDHAGLMFFPGNLLFRLVGRLALPIYGFMIAEGCKYTKNRLKYFLSVFLLGAVCQVVYFFFAGSTYFSVLITFSLSILTLYSLQFFRETVFDPAAGTGKKLLAWVCFPTAVGLVWLLNRWLTIDYGFWGCMLPVFSGAFQRRRGTPPSGLDGLDKPLIHVAMLGFGLLILAGDLGGIQIYALAAVPLLLCYSGRRGRGNLKYFFYIFYPVHLALLQGLAMLLGT